MSKFDMQTINVLNFNENEVYVDSAKEHYKFNSSRDGKTPTIVPMLFSEIQYIASNTDIILTGWLTFDDDIKEEIYKELRIPQWESILSNTDIENILTNPTLDGLQKIVAIDNQTYFDRVRIIMFKLMNEGVDVTTKVSRIVNQRYEELQNRQRNTNIILTKKDTSVPMDKVKELSEQNDVLRSEMAEMKQLIEKLLTAQTKSETAVPVTQSNSDNIEKKDNVKNTSPKKSGKSTKK